MSVKLSRSAYAGHYGPTVGDRVRLADTELIIEIEKDHTVYGEEVVFGGGTRQACLDHVSANWADITPRSPSAQATAP